MKLLKRDVAVVVAVIVIQRAEEDLLSHRLCGTANDQHGWEAAELLAGHSKYSVI